MAGRFRDKMQRFMSGRYGMDEFGRFLNIVTLVLLVISMFIQMVSALASYILWGLSLALIVYIYFRVFSRNFAARNRENQWYCNIRYRKNGGYSGRGYNNNFGGYNNNFGGSGSYSSYGTGNTYQSMTNEQKKAADRKTHKIFKCPNCSQKIRVPKHRGRICIKCPQCRIEFVRKT